MYHVFDVFLKGKVYFVNFGLFETQIIQNYYQVCCEICSCRKSFEQVLITGWWLLRISFKRLRKKHTRKNCS